jgi:hypothetical protein
MQCPALCTALTVHAYLYVHLTIPMASDHYGAPSGLHVIWSKTILPTDIGRQNATEAIMGSTNNASVKCLLRKCLAGKFFWPDVCLANV